MLDQIKIFLSHGSLLEDWPKSLFLCPTHLNDYCGDNMNGLPYISYLGKSVDKKNGNVIDLLWPKVIKWLEIIPKPMLCMLSQPCSFNPTKCWKIYKGSWNSWLLTLEQKNQWQKKEWIWKCDWSRQDGTEGKIISEKFHQYIAVDETVLHSMPPPRPAPLSFLFWFGDSESKIYSLLCGYAYTEMWQV